MSRPALLAEVEGIYAFDKPSGVLIHPAGTEAPDLVSWLAAQPELPPGLAPAHRLDAGTSGLVLAARGPRLAELARWFEQGRVEKTYLTLVHGRTHRKGVIRRPLKDGRRGRALAALTRWRAVEALPGCTLLAVRPATGRKHQLRRHLHGIGHPVVGDGRYRRPGRPLAVQPGRLWLHAWRISLPGGLRFEAPLPEELERHLAQLRALSAPAAGSR